MTEKELKQLVEDLIWLRDKYRGQLPWEDLDLIADACNVINHNVKKIAQAEWPKRWQV